MRKTRGRIVAADAQASMRDCLAAATPTAPQPVDFQAGLRTRTRIVCLRLQARTGPARLPVRHLAMRQHSGGCAGLARLPLRGQCRDGRMAASPASRFNPAAGRRAGHLEVA